MLALGPSPQARLRNVMIAACGVAAVLIGFVVMLLFAHPDPDPAQPQPKPRAVAVAPVAPPVAGKKPDARQEVVEVEVSQPTVTSTHAAAVTEKHATRPKSGVRPSEKVEAPAARVEERIPPGNGNIRVGAVGGEARVSVGSEFWGNTPVAKKVSSGQYVISVASADGKKRGICQAVVLPDHTARVIYNFDSGTCHAE